jgi:FkbM family methyltransferase
MSEPGKPAFRGFGLGLMRRLRRTPVDEAELVIRECRALIRGGVFYDIGANVGSVSEAMVGHASRIVAVEPDADIFPHLAARMGRRAICVQALVGPEGEERVFLHNQLASASSTSVAPGDAPPHGYLTPRAMTAVSLDRIAREHGAPDLIKIDVEGFELSVLASAPEVLARRPVVVMEFNSVCLSNFGRVNPRDAIDRILAMFPRVETITQTGRERVSDPYTFIYHNILTHGSVDNLVASWA